MARIAAGGTYVLVTYHNKKHRQDGNQDELAGSIIHHIKDNVFIPLLWIIRSTRWVLRGSIFIHRGAGYLSATCWSGNTQRGRTICTEGHKVHLWVSNALRWRSGPKSRVMAFRSLPVQLLEPPRSRIRADDSPCSGGKLKRGRWWEFCDFRSFFLSFFLSFFFFSFYSRSNLQCASHRWRTYLCTPRCVGLDPRAASYSSSSISSSILGGLRRSDWLCWSSAFEREDAAASHSRHICAVLSSRLGWESSTSIPSIP